VVGLFHEIGDKVGPFQPAQRREVLIAQPHDVCGGLSVQLELPRQCGDAILREFVAQYGEKLASMRHIFEDMIDEKKARVHHHHCDTNCACCAYG
jgi:hypothetical protein